MNTIHGPIRLFLNYATEDAVAVEQLYERLNYAPYEPWLDRRNIIAGEDWRRSIERALRAADFVLLCLSKRAVAKRGFVQREIRDALELWKEKLSDDIYVIPIRLDDCQVPDTIRQFQWVDLFRPEGFGGLLRSIRTGMERRQDTFVQPSPSTFITKRISESDSEQRAYYFNVAYPSFQPETDACLTDINVFVHAAVLKYIFEVRRSTMFSDEFTTRFLAANHIPSQDSTSTSFDVHLLTETLISMDFLISEYGAGAAHPNYHTLTLTFLRSPVRLVPTSHLFDWHKNPLGVISEYCYSDLATQITQDGGTLDDHQIKLLKNGTSPDADNFQSIVLTTGGATVFFDPYRVASYAFGRMAVRIPKSLIIPLLLPAVQDRYSVVG